MYYNFLSFVILHCGYFDGIIQLEYTEVIDVDYYLLSCCRVLELFLEHFLSLIRDGHIDLRYSELLNDSPHWISYKNQPVRVINMTSQYTRSIHKNVHIPAFHLLWARCHLASIECDCLCGTCPATGK